MSAADLAAEILKRREEKLSQDCGPWPKNQPIASDLSDCTRAMVLGITNWRDRPPFDPFVRARLDRGNLIEDAMVRELGALGLRVRVERTPFEIKNREGRVVLRGKVDGFVSGDADQDVPFEAKKMHPNVWAQINTVQDFGRYWWTKKYALQITAYLYANNKEEGFFLLDDGDGHWKPVVVPLDFGVMERILQQCEEAVQSVELLRGIHVNHVVERTPLLPPYHSDLTVCKKCWALNRVCFPPLDLKGYMALDDPELLFQLERREATQPAHREYEGLDRQLKDRFRGKDGLVIGPFLVTGKETPPRALPKEPPKAGWRCTIERMDAGKEETL